MVTEAEAVSDVPEGFKLTELGPLPREWQALSLRKAAHITSGGSAPQGDQYFGGTNPFVRVQHIDQGSASIVGWDLITDEAVRTHKLRLFPKGTVVLPKSGASIRLEKRAILPIDAYLVSHLCACAPRDDAKTDPSFLFYALRAIRFAADKADGYPTLRLSEIGDTAIPIPPVGEQRAIAHVLSTIQRAIEATERVIAAAREFKRSLMRHLFTYGPVPLAEAERVPLKETEIGLVPEHWPIVPLREVADIERGKFTHRPRNDPRFYGGTIPFVQTGDVARANGKIRTYSQTLNERGLSVSRVFPKGTILLTIAANIANCGLLEFDSAFPDSIVAITTGDSVDTSFLYYYLETQRKQMDSLAPRGTQKNINLQFLRPWPTPLPVLEEQREIATTFSAMNRKIEAEEKRKAALKELFRTMLHLLMTGQIRVKGL